MLLHQGLNNPLFICLRKRIHFQETIVVYGTWYMFHEIWAEELLTYFVNFN